MAAQKYGPPLVGMAETISAILNPTNKACCGRQRINIRSSKDICVLKKLTTIHPTDITPGPPVTKPYWNNLHHHLSINGDCTAFGVPNVIRCDTGDYALEQPVSSVFELPIKLHQYTRTMF